MTDEEIQKLKRTFGEYNVHFIVDKTDNINHPAHYETGKFECIDVMVETQGIEAVKSFCLCNAFKYLWRHRYKGNEESIDKALWYLQKYVELRGNTNENS